MNDIYFYVVTEQNFEEFKKRFIQENGDLVGYVLSVRDYETLAINMAEIKRYIEQQKQVIVYYEEAIKPKESLSVEEEPEKSKFLEKLYEAIKPKKDEVKEAIKEETDGEV